MTTEPPDSYEPDPTEPAETEPSEVEQDESIFSSGEGMVALGGAIVTAVFVIFELFLQDYNINTTTVVVAVVAIVLPRLDRDMIEQIAPLAVLMKLAGYLLLLVGVIEIIFDLRLGILDEFVTIIAALAAYAGYAIAFLGARSIET